MNRIVVPVVGFCNRPQDLIVGPTDNGSKDAIREPQNSSALPLENSSGWIRRQVLATGFFPVTAHGKDSQSYVVENLSRPPSRKHLLKTARN